MTSDLLQRLARLRIRFALTLGLLLIGLALAALAAVQGRFYEAFRFLVATVWLAPIPAGTLLWRR